MKGLIILTLLATIKHRGSHFGVGEDRLLELDMNNNVLHVYPYNTFSVGGGKVSEGSFLDLTVINLKTNEVIINLVDILSDKEAHEFSKLLYEHASKKHLEDRPV